MGGGVAVAANNGHAGQGPTLFRADDMHYTLAHVVNRIVDQAKFTGVGVKRIHLNAALFVFNTFQTVQSSWHVVIGHSDSFFWSTYCATCHPQTFKGLRACDLMNQMPVNIKQTGAVIGFMRHMRVPDFVIECFRGHIRRSLYIV